MTDPVGDGDGVERRLRRWEPADAPTLAAAWGDPEIARWNPVPADRSEDMARRWIEASRFRPDDSATLDMVMVDRTGAVLGEVGLRIDRHRNLAEVGFWIPAPERGRGEGRRLLALASRWADSLALSGLLAVTAPDNQAAIGLLTSTGWLEVRAVDGRRAFVDRRI